MKQKQIEEEKRMHKAVGILLLAFTSAIAGIVSVFVPGTAGKLAKWTFFGVFVVCIIYLVAKRKVR